MTGQVSIAALARRVLKRAQARNVMIATAESCTGGLVAGALTAIAGSSATIDRGFVTYSNAAKQEMLGVSESILRRQGAVSGETAAAMAAGALKNSRAGLAVAITGIAGPGGGGTEKPVGLVWFGIARKGQKPRSVERRFGAIGRAGIRRLSVIEALNLLADALE